MIDSEDPQNLKSRTGSSEEKFIRGAGEMLAERDEEIRLLEQLFDECVAGHGRIAMVRGTVASGKTELLRRTAEYAKSVGGVHIQAMGTPIEQGVPLGLLMQMFSRSPFDSTEAARIWELLSTKPPHLWQQDTDNRKYAGVPASVTNELCRKLIRWADEFPLLITVDDIHHSDVDSLEVLRHLVSHLSETRCLLVFSEAMHFPRVNPLLHTEMLRPDHFRRVRLQPLSEKGVAEVVAHQLGVTPAEQTVASYHRITGGNPLLVHALVEDRFTACDSLDADPQEPVVGHEFRQAVLTCLERSGPTTLETARVAAVLAGPNGTTAVSKTLLDRLTGLSPELSAHHLSVLRALGLLDGADQFRHTAARDVIVSDFPAERLQKLNLDAASLLHRQGAEAKRIAEHLLTVKNCASEPWAAPVLLHAAEDALVEDQYEFAVACLDMALESPADPHLTAKIRATLVRVGWRFNPASVKKHLSALVQDHEQGRLDENDTNSLLRCLLWSGPISEAADVIQRLFDRDGLPASRMATDPASLSLLLTCSFPSLKALVPERHADTPSPPMSLWAGRESRAGRALKDVLSGKDHETAVHLALQVLQEARLDDWVIDAVEMALMTLIYAERFAQARPLCDRLLAEASERRVPLWQARLSAVRAEIAIREGDAPTARTYSEQALSIIPAHAWGTAIGAPLSTLLHSSVTTNDREGAAEQLRISVPPTMFQSRFGLHYLYARGICYLSSERLQAAAADFEFCGALMRDWNIDQPSVLPWRSALALTQAKMGKMSSAETLAREELKLGSKRQPRTRGISLMALARSLEPQSRYKALEDAVEHLRSSGDRILLSLACNKLSSVCNLLGDARRARVLKQQSEYLVRDHYPHAKPRPNTIGDAYGPQAHPLLREAEPSFARLTESERTVAELAAVGRTNREISRQLYITVSTVEQHLTHVYRKLKIKSRADLPPLLKMGA